MISESNIKTTLGKMAIFMALLMSILYPSVSKASVIQEQTDSTALGNNQYCVSGGCTNANSAANTRWPVFSMYGTTWTVIRSIRVIWLPTLSDGTCPTQIYIYNSGGLFFTGTPSPDSGYCKATFSDPGAGPGGTIDVHFAFGSDHLNSSGGAYPVGTNSGATVTGFANVYGGGGGFDTNDTGGHASTLSDVAYYIGDNASDPSPSFPPYIPNKTRIVSFTPEEGTTTTSNDVHFNLHVYVSPDDIGDVLGVGITFHNIDQNSLLFGHDIYFLNTLAATTSGDFYFASTTNLVAGNYRINAKIERAVFGIIPPINPFSSINDSQSHQFVVVNPTLIGNISQNGFREFNDFVSGTTTATSTRNYAKNCNPLGDFDIEKCGTYLFVPGGDYLDVSISNLRAAVLVKFPIGYATRVYDIFNSSGTSSLPSFTVHIVSGAGNGTDMATDTLSFNMQDTVDGAGALLASIKDPIYGKNAKDVFGPWISLIVGLLVVLTIYADLTGSHGHAGPMEHNIDKQKKT